MKFNGNITLNPLGQSEIQNLVVERIATVLPAIDSAEKGRIIYFLADNTFRFNDGTQWSTIATGGNATVLQAELDALESSLGSFINGDGTFNSTALNALSHVDNASSLLDALSQIDAALSGKDQLAELLDVALVSPSNTEVLYYNQSTGKWVNHLLVLADISDVTSTATEVNQLHNTGVVAADLTKLHEVTATSTEINILAGTTVSATELNYVDGVTSSIQTQLNNKQPLDAQLTSIAGLTPVQDDVLFGTAGGTYVLDSGAGARGKLGLTIGTDVQAYDPDLTSLGAFAPADGEILVGTGGGDGLRWTLESGATARQSLGLGDVATHDDAEYVRVDGTHQYTANQSMGGFKIISLGAPVSGTDAANKAYVDSLSSGLVWLNPVCAINLISMDETDPVNITTKNRGDIYVVPPTGGAAWGSKPGHIMQWDGSTFLDKGSVSNFNISGRAVVSGYSSTPAAGAALSGKDNQVATFNFPFEYLVTGVNTGTSTFTIAGDHTSDFAAASDFYIGGSTGNDGYYTVVSSTLNGGNTDIVVTQTISSAVADGEIFDFGTPTFTVPANGNAVYVCNAISQYAYSQFVFDSTANSWVLFGGNTALVAGIGLSQVGNTMNINLGAGIKELPTDEVGIDIYNEANSALILTTDGSTRGTGADAALHLLLDWTDGGKLVQSVNGIKVDTNTISEVHLTGSVAGNGLTGGNGSALSITSHAGTSGTVGTLVVTADTVGVALGSTSTTAAPGNHVHAATVITYSNTTSGLTATDTQGAIDEVEGRVDTLETTAINIQTEVDAIETGAGLGTSGTYTAPVGTNYLGAATSLKNADTLLDTAIKTVETNVTTKITNGYHLYTAGAAATTHVITHGIGSQFCNVTVIDYTTNEQVIPQSVVFDSATQLTVTFNTALRARVVITGLAV